MKIKVFVVVDESWDSGDLNNRHEKYFVNKELRDDYFEFLRKDYLENMNLEEYDKNKFQAKTGYQRWSYFIDKEEKELEIIEQKNW